CEWCATQVAHHTWHDGGKTLSTAVRERVQFFTNFLATVFCLAVLTCRAEGRGDERHPGTRELSVSFPHTAAVAPHRRSTAVKTTLAIVAALACTGTASANITVTGTGKVTYVPNVGYVSVSVGTDADTAGEAWDKNSKAVKRLFDVLKSFG